MKRHSIDTRPTMPEPWLEGRQVDAYGYGFGWPSGYAKGASAEREKIAKWLDSLDGSLAKAIREGRHNSDTGAATVDTETQ